MVVESNEWWFMERGTMTVSASKQSEKEEDESHVQLLEFASVAFAAVEGKVKDVNVGVVIEGVVEVVVLDSAVEWEAVLDITVGIAAVLKVEAVEVTAVVEAVEVTAVVEAVEVTAVVEAVEVTAVVVREVVTAVVEAVEVTAVVVREVVTAVVEEVEGVEVERRQSISVSWRRLGVETAFKVRCAVAVDALREEGSL
jgi:hypothetical protein